MIESVNHADYISSCAPEIGHILTTAIYPQAVDRIPLADIGLPNGMISFANQATGERATAQIIDTTVEHNPTAHIRYATGNTFKRVLDEITADMSHTTASHWDEYANPGDSPFRFGTILTAQWDKLGIPTQNRVIWNGHDMTPETEMRHYLQELRKRPPVALTLAGIGPGSHIGYNVPGTPFFRKANHVTLDHGTLERDRQRGEFVDTHALTVGVHQALADSTVFLLVAFGPQKGDYLADAFLKPISTDNSAAALRLVGPKVLIFVDKAAAEQFRLRHKK